MKSESVEMSIGIAGLSDVNDSGRETKKVGDYAIMRYCIFWDPTNYFLTNKQYLLGLKLLSSWLRIQAHLTFAVHITLCSLPLCWKSPPDYCKKDEQCHSTHSSSSLGASKQEKAGTEPTCTHTNEHTHPWGALSRASTIGMAVSPASISSQWQGGGRLLSGCSCCLQETEQTENPGCLTHYPHKKSTYIHTHTHTVALDSTCSLSLTNSLFLFPRTQTYRAS